MMYKFVICVYMFILWMIKHAIICIESILFVTYGFISKNCVRVFFLGDFLVNNF